MKRHTLMVVEDDNLRQALHAQYNLGLSAFAEGLIAIEWRTYVTTFIDERRSPALWLQEMILVLWDMLSDMWHHRCSLLHLRDLSHKLHELEVIDRRIVDILQTTHPDLQPHERVLFRVTATNILNHTPRFRRLWLQRAEHILRCSKRRQTQGKYLHRERCLMQRWLGYSTIHRTPPQQPMKYTQNWKSTGQTTLRSWLVNHATTL